MRKNLNKISTILIVVLLIVTTGSSTYAKNEIESNSQDPTSNNISLDENLDKKNDSSEIKESVDNNKPLQQEEVVEETKPTTEVEKEPKPEGEKPAEQNDEKNKEELQKKQEEAKAQKLKAQEAKAAEKKLALEAETLASNEVNNVTELLAALAAASEGDVITLNAGFASSDITINMPSVNLTIEANSQAWVNGRVIIQGNGVGSLTINNLTLDGSSGTNNYLLENKSSGGKVVFNKLEVKNASTSAVYLGTSGTGLTEINDSMFHNNVSVNTASAIWLGNDANTVINNSTFDSNIGTGGGYETGAISSKFYRATLTINNTLFSNNINKTTNSGVIGGGGGAMAMHYLQGTVNINQSYFKSNSSNGADGTVGSSYDGGAIYVFDGRDGAVFNINQTTFDSNIAYDDGGAIMFQGTGNPGLTTSITSSTFVNNKAFGVTGGNVSGGAIQFFKNGGSSRMDNTLTSNTFVGNIGGDASAGKTQQGGAIGRSGAGFFATATVTLDNNLFIDNQVYGADGQINHNSNYKDVSGNTSAQLGTTNVLNADKGTTSANNRNTVIGMNNPGLQSNLSGITAGVERIIIPTVPIKPEGIADKTYTGNLKTLVDERNYSKNKDQGAVSMTWLKYDANGGKFGLADLTSYNGNVYYEGANPTNYYTVVGNGQSATVISAELNIQAPEGKVFTGWSTDKDATEPDPNYAVGTVQALGDGLSLYAIYKNESTLNVHYKSENAIELAPSYSLTQVEGSTHVIEIKDIEGYTFVNALDKDGNEVATDENGITYTFTDTTQDITLVYSRNPIETKLVVKFVDTLGTQIKDPFEISKLEGELYKLSIPKISGFTFTKAIDSLGNTIPSVSDIIDVIFGQTNQEITLVYAKEIIPETLLTVKYVDESGNILQEDTVAKQLVGTSYEIQIPSFEGYTFKDAKDASNTVLDPIDGKIVIVFTREDQTVTITYVKDVIPESSLIFKFVDIDGNELLPQQTFKQEVNTNYILDIPTINSYNFVIAKDNNNSIITPVGGKLDVKFTTEDRVVTLTYTKDAIPESTLVVNYVDELGNKLQDSLSVKQNVGTKYSIQLPIIEGYSFKVATDLSGDTLSPANGIIDIRFTLVNQEVTLTYSKDIIPETLLTINFVDMNGVKLADSKVVKQVVGTTYEFTVADFEKYTFNNAISANGEEVEAIDGKIKVQFGAENQEITLRYRKDEIAKHALTINFVDMNGNKLSESKVVRQTAGSTYEFMISQFDKYSFNNALDMNANEVEVINGKIKVQFGNSDQEITLRYKKDIITKHTLTINYVDMDGNRLSESKVIKQAPATTYEFMISEFDKYSFNNALDMNGNEVKVIDGKIKVQFGAENQEITLRYKKDEIKKNALTINYLDADGNKIHDSFITKEEAGSIYGSNIPTIKGYTFKEVVGLDGTVVTFNKETFNVEIKNEDQIVNVIYTKDKEKDKDKKPNTGAKNDIALPAILMIASGSGLIAIFVVLKKKKNETK